MDPSGQIYFPLPYLISVPIILININLNIVNKLLTILLRILHDSEVFELAYIRHFQKLEFIHN